MTLEWLLVGAIELLAVAFLVWKLLGGRVKRPRVLSKPDVPVSALVRGQYGEGGGTGKRRAGGSFAD